MNLPNRRKDWCLARFNVSGSGQQMMNTIRSHATSKMHESAIRLVEDQQDKDWSNHAYLALGHLVKLRRDEDFPHTIVEAKQAGCKLHNAMYSTREFYDKILKFSGPCEDSTLREELAQSQFGQALVIAADAKEHMISVRIYFLGLLILMGITV